MILFCYIFQRISVCKRNTKYYSFSLCIWIIDMTKKNICGPLAHLRKRLNIGCNVHIKIGLIDKAVKANNAYITGNRKTKLLYSLAGTRYTRICAAEKCSWFFLKFQSCQILFGIVFFDFFPFSKIVMLI